MEIATKQKRRSRMRRTCTGKHIELQPRDIEIFRLLHRYRYLRSTHIHAFVGGDRTKLIERLGRLFHDGGYLDRPEQQWDVLGSRCQPVVYSVNERAAAFLQEWGELETSPLASFGNGRQFQHALMVCEVLAAIELAAMERGVRLISWDEIRKKAPQAGQVPQIPVSISCSFGGRTEHADVLLTPDAVFGLEYAVNGTKSYRFFALEADRGTMPVERTRLSQSSYLKKILCYRQINSLGLHRTAWGVPNLLVLNVMSSIPRVETALSVAERLVVNRANNWLLFALYERTGDALSGRPWRRIGLPSLDIFVH